MRNRVRMRRPSRPRGYGTSVVLPLVVALAAACSDAEVAAPGDDQNRVVVIVHVENDGSAPGSVQVVFSEGTDLAPCPAVLAPGATCQPNVITVETNPVDSVTLEASTDTGVEFVGWGGDCALFTGPECVLLRGSEFDVSFDVSATFEPIVDAR